LFNTIVPGHYGKEGNLRPSHIHFKISGPRKKELVSQIYFEGDAQIPTDVQANTKQAASRILPLDFDTESSELRVRFDIFL
jgi:protocatechuate 3,4-dioxygenase beta subunit